MLMSLPNSKDIMQINRRVHEKVYSTVLSDYWLTWMPNMKAPNRKKSNPSATFASALIDILNDNIST